MHITRPLYWQFSLLGVFLVHAITMSHYYFKWQIYLASILTSA